MLVLSGRVELMVIPGGVKNNYEHNIVVMNLPLCPQTADDVNVKGKLLSKKKFSSNERASKMQKMSHH